MVRSGMFCYTQKDTHEHPSFCDLRRWFWAQFQLSAWRELANNQCVAISNPTRSKAEALAKKMEIAGVYSDPAELLEKEQIDFVDIISSVESHYKLAQLAIEKRFAGDLSETDD